MLEEDDISFETSSFLLVIAQVEFSLKKKRKEQNRKDYRTQLYFITFDLGWFGLDFTLNNVYKLSCQSSSYFISLFGKANLYNIKRRMGELLRMQEIGDSARKLVGGG